MFGKAIKLLINKFSTKITYMEQPPKVEIPKEEHKDVTPLSVHSDGQVIDYDKLVKEFGCSLISADLISKFEKITGHKAHILLRRGMFFTHRDLDFILDQYSQAKPFFIYTGRGPSSTSLHLGHIVPFIFTKYLQDVFDVPVVIQITDDEKFLYSPTLALETSRKNAIENIKDIIACGFNPEKTFIFQDTEYIANMYINTIKVQKMITLNQIKGIFGFNDSENIGKFAFPAVQAVPCFSNTFPHIFGTNTKVPCLIPMVILLSGN
jgi:tryptophanyl-tRNA synthetase